MFTTHIRAYCPMLHHSFEIRQTNWAVKWANEAIEDVNLRSSIESEVDLINTAASPDPQAPNSGYEHALAGTAIKLANGVSITMCATTGAVCGLVDAKGHAWASESRPLALFTYALYTNDQMAAFRKECVG